MKRRQFISSLGLATGACILPWLESRSLAPFAPNPATSKAIARIQALNREFPTIGVYHKPNDQDRKSAGSGFGISACDGRSPCQETDQRSESVYLPFVMAPRRQTDALVRQAYFLLPEKIRQSTAFIIVDRLVQFPEAYLPYLQRSSRVVLIGNFFGIGAIQTEADYFKTDNGTGTRSFHRMQLRQLEYAIALIQSLRKPIVDILYGLGDSMSDYSLVVRRRLQLDCEQILLRAKLNRRLFSLDWGADELVFKAFARQLPSLRFKLVMANPKAKHHYDANRTTAEILQRTLRALNVVEVKGNNFDAQVMVFDRYPGAPSDFNRYFAPNDSQQAQFDQKFRQTWEQMNPRRQAKTVILDGRNPNGALNPACLPNSDRYLAFGSWGTFANTCGQTLAIAKLLIYAQNRSAQRQFLLEAIAHDVFCIGYGTVQDIKSPMRSRLQAQGLRYIHKDPPNYTLGELTQVMAVMNELVNQQMRSYLPNLENVEVVVIPQLWRLFESQVFLKTGGLSVAGVFRKDLPAKTFNPLQILPQIKSLTLTDLNR